MARLLELLIDSKPGVVRERLTRAYQHWAFRQNIAAQHGGGVMCHYAVVVKTVEGKQISFRQMGGEVEPPWPDGDARLGSGPGVYLCLDIFGLERCLRRGA